ncbi:4Fe-4S cluster-binding domain-containing protein [Geobacter sp. SVR]|uniref:4Fe-4S cluster-binding domain-containing protein n=1 Tax=Geobacter sp. SVR TaxID=2495594 RepID=UPI00143EF702|nr:4Fe-4S cluster-binding domain-containing protein [Geobacter sp. SVR]BCS53950.1 radical SAM protein [Geobacter sp. SVR]GCF86269.1 radical SAM protein [Geobacter sp. SVR]
MHYLDLYQSGELLQRVREAYRRLAACDLCPHDCGVNRIAGETGLCGAGAHPRIASANVHRGEEPPISGTRGSGTIFLSGCSLKCRFCQNFPISQLGNGEDTTAAGLAQRMLKLQRQRVHNINFVTPTHYLPQILAALYLAIPQGFRLPIVWNSSGYEKVDALRLLDGVVAVYLPDMKYASNESAVAVSGAPGYSETNRDAVAEMLRQVGHLRTDEEDIALSGLIVRHLVLPEGKGGSRDTLSWIARNLGTETHVALMSQYFPAHRAMDTPGIDRTLTGDEYDAAVEALEEASLENGWVQELDEERGAV